MKDPYDVRRIFDEMVMALIASLKRNFTRHKGEELKEGFRWEMWQVAKLRALAAYQKRNRKVIEAAIKEAEGLSKEIIEQSYDNGTKRQESWWSRTWNRMLKPFGLQRKEVEGRIVVPEDIKPKLPDPVQEYLDMPLPPKEESFFKLNEQKLDALQDGIKKDLRNTQGAIYRKMDDVYRQVIYQTSHYVAAGAKTLEQAVDMATKEFLNRGIDAITYSDGRRVEIGAYAEMALRTVSQRATFMAEGKKRDEWGIYTVVMSAHDNCSPWCMPYQGTVMIDDVYTSLDAERAAQMARETKYVRLTHAMAEGAFHPNCRHTLATFFPGISNMPEPADETKAKRNYEAEQRQRYIERQIRRYKRLEAGSLNPDNQARYAAKVKEWQDRQTQHLAEHPELRRDRRRETVTGELTPGERTELLQAAADREKIEEVRQHIQSDDVVKTIHAGQQGKHIPGHNNFIEGKSYLTITADQAQELVKQHAGTGEVRFTQKGEWNNKEYIVTDDQVGVYIDQDSGQELKPDGFTIHYGKRGTHIVPYRKQR